MVCAGLSKSALDMPLLKRTALQKGFPRGQLTTPALPLPGRCPSAGQHLGWGWLQELSEIHRTHVLLLHLTQSHVNFKRKA